jgi:hypothetical protein
MLAPSPAKSPLDYDFDVIDVLWIDAALAELGYSKTDTPRLEDRIGASVTRRLISRRSRPLTARA